MIVQTKWQNSPDNDEIKVTRALQCTDVGYELPSKPNCMLYGPCAKELRILLTKLFKSYVNLI
jgi:hypothetical protein